MSPVIYQGRPCRLCVGEQVVPAGGQWRAGICSRHWYREAYFGRLDPSPECEPGVPPDGWVDALLDQILGGVA